MRFVPKSDLSKVLIGEPVDENVDVGLALRNGEELAVTVFAGTSVLAPGQRSDRTEVVDRVLSPVTRDEAGPIRCVGLNVSANSVIFHPRRADNSIVSQPCEGDEDGNPWRTFYLPVGQTPGFLR